jgi:hypothetical protein
MSFAATLFGFQVLSLVNVKFGDVGQLIQMQVPHCDGYWKMKKLNFRSHIIIFFRMKYNCEVCLNWL